MTDEEALRLVQKVTALPGFTRGIGTRVVAARPGCVTMALERRPDLLQPQGHFHGGVISALADHAAGGAVTTAFPAGRFAVTVDLHVNFLAPAQGDELVAVARAIQAGGTIGVAQVEIFAVKPEARHVCAVAVATMRAVEMPAGGLRAAGQLT